MAATINAGCKTDESLPVLPGTGNYSSPESTVATGGGRGMLHNEHNKVQKVLRL